MYGPWWRNWAARRDKSAYVEHYCGSRSISVRDIADKICLWFVALLPFWWITVDGKEMYVINVINIDQLRPVLVLKSFDWLMLEKVQVKTVLSHILSWWEQDLFKSFRRLFICRSMLWSIIQIVKTPFSIYQWNDQILSDAMDMFQTRNCWKAIWSIFNYHWFKFKLFHKYHIEVRHGYFCQVFEVIDLDSSLATNSLASPTLLTIGSAEETRRIVSGRCKVQTGE